MALKQIRDPETGEIYNILGPSFAAKETETVTLTMTFCRHDFDHHSGLHRHALEWIAKATPPECYEQDNHWGLFEILALHSRIIEAGGGALLNNGHETRLEVQL